MKAIELVKVLSKLGYVVHHQKGSHLHLRSSYYPTLTVPNHNPIARGTLRAIIREIGISVEAFLELL